MRKIKDLCTVLVDNSFRLRPIDKERYELFVATVALILVRENERGFGFPGGDFDPGVQEWLRSTDETLYRSVCDLVTVYHSERADSSITGATPREDRARRLLASLSRTEVYPDSTIALMDSDIHELLTKAWIALVRTMHSTPGFVNN
jgi:hypothetical protein